MDKLECLLYCLCKMDKKNLLRVTYMEEIISSFILSTREMDMARFAERYYICILEYYKLNPEKILNKFMRQNNLTVVTEDIKQFLYENFRDKLIFRFERVKNLHTLVKMIYSSAVDIHDSDKLSSYYSWKILLCYMNMEEIKLITEKFIKLLVRENQGDLIGVFESCMSKKEISRIIKLKSL